MRKRSLSFVLIVSMMTVTLLSGCVSVRTGEGEYTLPEIADAINGETDEEPGAEAGSESALKDKVLTDLPTSWDLTELYADEDAFEADMKRVEELIPSLEALRGTLNTVEGLLKNVEDPDVMEVDAILFKAEMYTGFLSSLDSTDPWARKASARYSDVSKKVGLAYAFKLPEIMEMPLEEREKLFSDERLKDYKHFFRKYTDPDYTVLGEEAGRVSTIMGSAFGSEDTYGIFDNIELPRPTFSYPDGTEGVLTDQEYARIAQSGEYDQEFRKEILKLRNSMREPYANTYASLLEGAMKANWAKAQINGFDSTLDAALYNSEVEPEIYDRIIDFSHTMLPKIHEYYEARRQILGYDEFNYSDLVMPVTDYEPKHISYEEAVNMGRAGISVWGDEYLDVFDRIITSPHVDVYPSDTKESGAFEYLVGNETLPFVMLNFDGFETYTSTIVHEMGHGVYSELSAENQNASNNCPGIFTQEVASTANEIMYHKYMIENAETDEEKLYWMDAEINLFMNTIIRQCLYSEFEDYCYKTIEGGGALDAGEMADKWMELTAQYYGDKVAVPDNMGIDWARIPHLYYDYYVYKYATSITYAASICELVDEKGQEEKNAYLEFLKAGTVDVPSELLKIAGVDPLDDATYDAAGEYISGLIDEFIETAGAAE
ncbi:MAG: hypothetical protein K6E63_00410 [Lachnospiraceae bacterium]|nr:hypothetical protein [Lachnospiraceae bacterium]